MSFRPKGETFRFNGVKPQTRPIFLLVEFKVMEYKRIQRVYGLDSNTEYNVEFKKRIISLDFFGSFFHRWKKEQQTM